MDFDNAVAVVMKTLEQEAMATNAKLTAILGDDTDLYEQVRQHVILNDLADDKKGVGLVLRKVSAPPGVDDGSAVSTASPSSADRPQVFISYATEDNDAAVRIRQELETQGIRCWFAPRELREKAGTDFADELIEAIYTVGAMLVVASPRSASSPWVPREVNRAINRGIPVIPVRVQNYEPRGAMELYLATPQWLNAYPPPIDRYLTDVVLAVRRCLASDTVPKDPTSTAKRIVAAFQRARTESNPPYAAFWLGSRFASMLDLVAQARSMQPMRRAVLDRALRSAAAPFEKTAGLKTGLMDGIAAMFGSRNQAQSEEIKRRVTTEIYKQIEAAHGASIASWLVHGMGVSSLWSQTRHGGREVPLHQAVHAARSVFAQFDELLAISKAEPAYALAIEGLKRRFDKDRSDMTALGAIATDLTLATEMFLLTGTTELDLDLLQPIVESSPQFALHCLNRYVSTHPNDARAHFLLGRCAANEIFGSVPKVDPLFPLDKVEIFARALEGTIRLEPGTERAAKAEKLLQTVGRFRKTEQRANSTPPSPASTLSTPARLVWAATFSGDGISKWHRFTHLGVEWSASDGVCKGSGVGFLTTPDELWADFTVEVDVRLVSASPEYGDVGIVARYSSGRDTAVGYHFYLATDGIAHADVYERKGRSRPLAAVPCPVQIGHWYRLRVTAVGPTMVFAVDGRPMVRIADTFSSVGGLGLRVAKAEAEFRNMTANKAD